MENRNFDNNYYDHMISNIDLSAPFEEQSLHLWKLLNNTEKPLEEENDWEEVYFDNYSWDIDYCDSYEGAE